ncbi:hypothetical protein HG535_0G00470 [Zygotorulaspora mrakii]|uniref:Uncharacterized protein n=1 Tax=Zygotorulaspora mrakii TaxID=42260 RepID=A0A7H9B8U6_ZYGMR|nr:uncharacterized protein HG535_0G00470 [Zygotorulaspora mrakii]QLG74162.1 hypothetical protein HG535_0G00470 [Zygotorulaspora mrakii]
MVGATWQSLLCNVVSVVTSSWGLFKCTKVVLPPSLSQAGHKQFLTNIAVAFTIVNNVANIANHLVQRLAKDAQLKRRWYNISRHVTLPIAMVLESIVATVYWPLRLFALQFIMQDVAKGRAPIPYKVDIAIHLLPLVFQLYDHYLSGYGSRFKLSYKHSWLIITSFGLFYNRYLHFLIVPNTIQSYPYPFLNVDEPLRSVIFVVVTSASCLFYALYQSFTPKAQPLTKRE